MLIVSPFNIIVCISSYFNEAQKLLKSPVHFLMCSFVVLRECQTVVDIVNGL